MYRLWSALTKNIRYIIDQKNKIVTVPRLGCFFRSQSDPALAAFMASNELVSCLNATQSAESPQGETTGPEWPRIAPAASMPSQEVAHLFAQAVFLQAIKKAKQGEFVVLNLRFGKLTLSLGQIGFESEVLASVSATQSVRSYPISTTSMHTRANSDYNIMSPAPNTISAPITSASSPREGFTSSGKI